MTMITPSYLGETIEYSSLHACRSTLEDPTTTSTETDNYLTDALGSTVALTGSTGSSQVEYSYGPFGSISITGTTTNSYTYTGREIDGLGINYYRARYYNPAIGRFISEDPMGFEGSGANLYAYVNDSPINFIDPPGLRCTCSYGQSSGMLRCVDNATGKVVAQGIGYSGIGPGLNNPSMQGVEDTGPLPQGSYSIGLPNTKKGPITIPLTPSQEPICWAGLVDS